MRHYDRNKCDNKLRKQTIDEMNRTILLIGRHAFEYKIIISCKCRQTIITYKDRKSAYKAFNSMKPRKR